MLFVWVYDLRYNGRSSGMGRSVTDDVDDDVDASGMLWRNSVE